MYKLYIISYSGANSQSIKDAVKTFGAWFNNFDNQYIVCTTLTIEKIEEKLETKINQGSDKLLIIEVELKQTKGWLNNSGWEWIKSQRRKLQ